MCVKNFNYIITGHCTDWDGIPHDLVKFLERQGVLVISAFLPFSYNKVKKNFIIKINNEQQKSSLIDFKMPEIAGPFRFMTDVFFLTKYLFKFKKHIDNDKKTIFIATNPLDFLPYIFLKKILHIKYSIFFPMDYTKNRFRNKFFDYIYQCLYRFTLKKCNLIWNGGSYRLKKIFVEMGAKREKIQKLLIGYWKMNFLVSFRKIRRKIFYGGSITEGSGLQEVIKALVLVRKEISDIELVVIGDGDYMPKIKELVQNYNLIKNVHFIGYKHGDDYFKALCECDISVAPYVADKMNLHYYASCPSKIVAYLSCGLPVITTDIITFSKEIEQSPAGIVINSEDNIHKKIAEGILKLINDDDFYKKCQINDRKIMENRDWNSIFEGLFQRTFLYFEGIKKQL